MKRSSAPSSSSSDASSTPPTSAKKRKKEQTFLDRYKKIPGIEVSTLGNTFARCVYCKTDVSIAHSGIYDIQRHCRKNIHQQHEAAAKTAAKCASITSFMPSQNVKMEEEPTIRAEVMLTELTVRTNLPLSTADIISRTVKSAFPDSKIVQNYSCCRNKATAIIKCMAAETKDQLRQKISSGPFCVATDGSNDQRQKQYPVVITTVGDSGVEQSLLSVPVLDLQTPSTGELQFEKDCRLLIFRLDSFLTVCTP